MDLNFDLIFVPTCKRFEVSAQPPAKKTAGLIIKKTVPFWRSFIQGLSKYRLLNTDLVATEDQQR
jgi:hypothetical protein